MTDALRLLVDNAGKSTSYTVFCLWYILTNKDKTILICANKFGTAKDILQRIRMAYEELPNWLKPGVVEWNRSSISFDNGCRISAEATSGSSGRGSSINCLVCDEFAFLKPGVEDEFLQSVFPVVSSSKNSKIIIVSTPHGMGNEFYRIWSHAISGKSRWKPVQVNWNEVPGRDQEWMEQQLESFGGNRNRFEQEYGCSFLGSSDTLLSQDTLRKLKSQTIQEPKELLLHPKFPQSKIRVWEYPIEHHAYVIGADPSMGLGADYQAMVVYDITDTHDIRQVAGFYENDVDPKLFAFMIAKTGLMYNQAYVAMENNGVSQVALQTLWRDYEYDSLIHEGGNERTSIGICSTNTRKSEACLNFRNFFEDDRRTVTLRDPRLITELEKFERTNKPRKIEFL